MLRLTAVVKINVHILSIYLYCCYYYYYHYALEGLVFKSLVKHSIILIFINHYYSSLKSDILKL